MTHFTKGKINITYTNALGSKKTKHKTIQLSKDSSVTPYFANLT